MTETGLRRPDWWKVAIAFCAIWNVLYAATSAATGAPVFLVRSVVPSYFFLPVYAWLVWGLWKEKYAAWILGLIACAPFALGGIAKFIAILIHQNRETILPMGTPLQVIGICAIVTNVFMGIVLVINRENYSPGY